MHTDDLFVEKMIQFSRQIPGFQNISRTTAKRLFYLFTHQKVRKGWQMHSKIGTGGQQKQDKQ